MKYVPDLAYPDDELEKLGSLRELFGDWHQCFEGTPLPGRIADDLVFDGFYPYYFAQRPRILFVGRESRDIPGQNYIELLHGAYRTRKQIGSQHLNKSKFHARLLRITWGISHQYLPWDKIPSASSIGNQFGTAAGVSFAFMNISKLSNLAKSYASDWHTINEFHCLSTSERNFPAEQMAMLEPQVVVTMGLGKKKLESFGSLSELPSVPGAKSFRLDIGSHRCLVIESFHFSAPRKKARVDFYEPICWAIRQAFALGLLN